MRGAPAWLSVLNSLRWERERSDEQNGQKAQLLRNDEIYVVMTQMTSEVKSWGWKTQRNQASCRQAKDKMSCEKKQFVNMMMLSGSAWRIVRKCMEDKSKEFDVVVGIEHRLQGEEAHEAWTKVSKCDGDFQIAAASARITKQDDLTDCAHRKESWK